MSTSVPAELTASWQHTLEHWTLKASHDTLLGLAAKHQQLAWLAARYRLAMRTNPADPIVQERLARVQRAAAVIAFAMPVDRGAPERTPYRAGVALLVAAVMATLLGLWLTDVRIREHRQHQLSSTVSRQP